MAGSSIVKYESGLHEWAALYAALPQHLQERVTSLPSVPFFSVFQSDMEHASLPCIPHRLVLSDEEKLHAGCSDGLLRAVEYKSADGSLCCAWLGNCNVVDGNVDAYHIHLPGTLALTNEAVRDELAKSYWQRNNHVPGP